MSTTHAEALFERGQQALRAQRYAEAERHYRSAADGGHLRARLQLAQLLLLGAQDQAGRDEGVQQLRIAEQAGDPEAAYLLAGIELGSPAFDGGLARLQSLIETAAARGHLPACRALALELGRRPDADSQAQATELLEHGARSGDAVAAQLLVARLRAADRSAAERARAQDIAEQLRAAGFPPLPGGGDAESDACVAAAEVVAGFEGWLQIPPQQLIAESPMIAIVPGLLWPEACRYLMAMAAPLLRPSRVFNPTERGELRNDVRTSSDAFFDPVLEDFGLRLLQTRISAAAGLRLWQAEPLVVLRYAPGQQYHPHLDVLSPSVLASQRPEAGQRVRTACTYLNAVEEGGQTQFPRRDLQIAPTPGSVLVFDNVDAEGRAAAASLHAGLPVVRGEKWLATLWFRQGVLREL
jgi:prolyl 4-hydroxylase